MLLSIEELTEIVACILKCSVEDIKPDTLLVDIGLDSLRFVSMVVAIESKYNIELLDSDLDLRNFTNVTVICDTLKKYFNQNDKKLYKCIITDCDGVLWRGISGEAGDDSAYWDDNTREYGNLLHTLRKNGIMLAICSKNEYKNIESMLDPVILSLDDFAVVETDVMDKANSVSYILNEFGFFVDNVIYVDNDDAELAYLKSKYPGLTLMKADYQDCFISDLGNLFSGMPTTECIDRTMQFREQKEREKVHAKANSPDEYNRVLETKIMCGKATIDDVSRIAELSQRANRFNLTGARYNVSDIESMLVNVEYTIYILRASDRFGDLGIVAMAILNQNIIESFIMSCRVFGRGFENELLTRIKHDFNACITGIYKQTGKNDYCKDFYSSCGVPYELL